MKIQELLLQSFSDHAQNTAVIDGDRVVTYEELLRAANKVTKYLLDAGATPEANIGVLSDRRLDHIVGMIGIMNARCAYVPVDPNLPHERLASMADQLNMHTLLSPDQLPGIKDLVLGVHSLVEIQNRPVETVGYPIWNEEDNLYVFFTSGSTGVPKGVIGKNKSVAQFVNWEISQFGIDHTYKVSQLISPYFDAFLRDVFVPLLAGGTVCIPADVETIFEPVNLIDWIDQQGINLIHCVPTVFGLFNNHDRLNRELFKSLKYVLLSGEAIYPASLGKWYETFENRVQLVNFYGLTETTMIRTFYEIQPTDIHKSRIPVGKAIADTEILITDKSLNPQGKLIPGDLYIVSDYLSNGYLNDPALNEERFLTIDGRPAFRTGDKAKWLADGKIELLGREDRVTKLRGIRIDLDEIEHVISNGAELTRVAVLTFSKEKDHKDARLLCFVQAKAGNLDVKALESYTLTHLPEAMAPSEYVVVEEFPQLSSGKIDNKGLIKLWEEQRKEVVPAANATEERLMKVWQEILDTEELSADDNFLAVGGSSLTLMRLTAKIYMEFNVRIPLGELFKNLTIQQQAKFIGVTADDGDDLKISKVESQESYHITGGQERLYTIWNLDKNNTNYNLPNVLQFRNKPDIDKVYRAMRQVVARHEALRTVFVTRDNGVEQKVLDQVKFELNILETEQIDKAINEFVQPFNLNEGPLFRVGLIHTGYADYLIIDLHQIISDAISQNVLLGNFITFYLGGTLDNQELDFKDYAAWENTFSTSEAYKGHREFWLNAFEGGVPQLPFGEPKVANDNDQTRKTSFTVRKDTLAPVLNELSKDNTTSASAFYASFLLILTKLTRQEDLVVGMEASGRVQEEVQNMVGSFEKTLPVRYQVNLDESFKALANRANKHLAEVQNKQHYDLHDLLLDLNKKSGAAHEKLFQVIFNYEPDKVAANAEYQEHFTPYEVKRGAGFNVPLKLTVEETDTSFEFAFDYAPAYFGENEMEDLLEGYESLLQRIATSVDQQVFDLVTEQEESAVTDDIEFNF